MLDQDILRSLEQRPDLPRLAAALNERLAAEAVDRAAFRRDLSPSVKAEFIAGKTVMHSPAKAKHLRATLRLLKLMDVYIVRHKLGEVFSEKALIRCSRNDYEPDIVFFTSDKSDAFEEDQLDFPPPDMIVEVLSESTESRDRGVKFTDYADHDVREYWIVDCDEMSIEQYVLRDGETTYHLAQKLTAGSIASTVITGFTVPVVAIFDKDENAATLRRLLD